MDTSTTTPIMNRKRSSDDPQSLRRSKRLMTHSSTQRLSDARSQSTSVPPFNLQDQSGVFPSITPHQGTIQNHEMLRGRPEAVPPLYSNVDWPHYPNSQNTQTDSENHECGHSEHAPYAEEIQHAQPGVSGCNSLIQGSSEPSVPLGNRVLIDQRVSLEEFAPASSTFGTPIRRSYDSGCILPDQSLRIARLPEPGVAQLPMHNHMFQSAQKVNIGGNAKLMNIAGKTNVINHWHDGTHGLEKMEKVVSFSAQFDSSAQDPERICHPGTRQNVMKRMQDWINDSNSIERIFWLHGPAGAGKSAIAQTIAQSCSRQQVVATFFFFKSDPSRNDGNRLFPTLAYQLAFAIPTMKDHIAQALHERPDLPTKGIEMQFNELIARPFQYFAEAASQQSSPDNIIAAIKSCQDLAPVIIIDGVDECMDEKLQQRFLKIIGDAVKDRSIPFRFLICSRPEANIEVALKHFETLIRSIDLAELDDANRDIEKFLMDEFSRIASERHLRPSWPGRAIIHDIIYKSSGNFIFASVVVKFVGDEDNLPEDQLDIILNLKPPEKMSPFAALDELYLEILNRQLHQDFLKTFLTLFVGRIEIMYYHQNSEILLDPSDAKLYKDDAKLMGVSKEVLHTKLRKMRSLLKFEPHIDVHHRSFLDFLTDRSRSKDYYVSKRHGRKLYLDLIIKSIVHYVSKVIENPDYPDLDFELKHIIQVYPLAIDLTIGELRDVSRPLYQVQDRILEQLDPCVTIDLLFCRKCTFSNFIRPLLLHLAILQCIDIVNEGEESVTKGNGIDAGTSLHPEAIQSVLETDLDNILSSVLTHLHETKLGLSPSTAIIKCICSLLHFDCTEIASKVRSMSDAQRLVDLLVDLIDEEHILNQYEPDGMSKAVQLVLNIFVRIPVLPRSLLFRVERIADIREFINLIGSVEVASLAILVWRILDHNYIHLAPFLEGHSLIIPWDDNDKNWEDALPLDSCTVIALMLEIARTIQYLHSMGITPGDMLYRHRVYFDLGVQPRIKISSQFLQLINPYVRSTGNEDCIFTFGCLFYQIYFNENVSIAKNNIVQRPSSPTIAEYAWQFIQHCCAEDPKERPTIDEIVEEMETWRI